MFIISNRTRLLSLVFLHQISFLAEVLGVQKVFYFSKVWLLVGDLIQNYYMSKGF